ncbi:MAG: flagellar hook-length control protein FliK [Lachnospiraceae bacterium]|nr:flagellar hook-length control protein FliK [Lachnospiraceae bacterium]
MRLTDLQINDRQISETSGSRQADPARSAAINRQIRSMAPGQTFQGEVILKNGSEVQIRLSEDMVLNARVDRNMNLEVGKNMTFEVRSNGSTLTLSPLFSNTATEANALKALDMASLPVNSTTVNMTRLLMDAGLPIDRNYLQQVFREVNAFPRAQISDIVDLHRLSLPVNEENVQQMGSYKNLTYQILDGMNLVMEELENTIQGMVQTENAGDAAGLYQEIVLLAGEFLQGQEESAAAGQGPAVTGQIPAGDMPVGEDIPLLKEQEGAAVGPERTEGAQDALSRAMSLLEEIAGGGEPVVSGGTVAGQPQSEETLRTAGQSRVSLQNLTEELYGLLGETKPQAQGDMDASRVFEMAGQILQKGIRQQDTGLLKSLLQNQGVRELVRETLREAWTLRPEDVADAKKVEELYQRLDKQLKSLAQALERTGQEGGSACKAVANMSQNLDFLQQVNHFYTYVQLPLRLHQGEAHGDLYVYTNKKNLAAKDGKISALLHLDMEHLGPLDVYVAMQDQKVSTQFYVQDDDMLSFLSEHMDQLTGRLKKRGYDCTYHMQVRGFSEEGSKGAGASGGIHSLLAQAGHVSLAEYAFDVRA